MEVLHIPTGKINQYHTISKAALAFYPATTGQTVKAYIENGKLFRGEYRISYFSPSVQTHGLGPGSKDE